MTRPAITRTPLAFLLVGLATGCQPDDPVGRAAPLTRFPDGFRFGSATAGFQVDMGCPTWSTADCDDPASDWYQWVTDPGIVADAGLHVNGDPVSMGPGMWETLESDADLMVADGHTTYRMSIEWSRLFPAAVPDATTSVDELVPLVNAAAVARYHEMFAALRGRGIEPVVTVNHYTLPLWIHDGVACHEDLEGCTARGWLDRDRILHHLGLYAGFVGREFGADIDLWFTLNEPYATALSGYLMPGEDRSSPPGVVFQVQPTKDVILNQIEGHAAMAHALRAEDAADADGDGRALDVGIVMNMVSIVPKDPNNADDVRGAAHMDYLYHQLYLGALTDGDWDPELDGEPSATREDLAGTLDVIGINYYNQVTVTGLPGPLRPEIPVFDFLPEFSWDPFPAGLGEVVERAARFDRPIHITENGTPHVDDRGVEVLDGHLASLLGAMDAGADVRSYHYWSLVDNYEWNHGFDLRFGLYELDPATKARVARPVSARLREFAEGAEVR